LAEALALMAQTGYLDQLEAQEEDQVETQAQQLFQVVLELLTKDSLEETPILATEVEVEAELVQLV
jgi:hypothetical protein